MTSTHAHTTRHPERRQEPRIPLFTPTRIAKTGTNKATISGTSRNLSLHGVQCLCTNPVAHGDQVTLTITLPTSQESFSAPGIVKWCEKINDKYLSGIKLLKENNISIPLQDIECIAKNQETAYGNERNKNRQKKDSTVNLNIYKHVYWGFFLSLCNQIWFEQCNKLTHETDLTFFYLSLIRDNLSKELLEPSDYKKIDKIQEALNNSHRFFHNFSEILKIISDDYKSNTENNIYSTVHFNALIRNRIVIAKKICHYLSFVRQEKITYSTEGDFFLFGHCDKLSKALDFLFLYTLQFILFGNAKFISINTLINEDFHLIIQHDGTKISNQETLRIYPDKNCLDTFDKDFEKSNILWLQIVANFFAEQEANIAVSSESGNNIINLTIPKKFAVQST